jgi:hypothetical protein
MPPTVTRDRDDVKVRGTFGRRALATVLAVALAACGGASTPPPAVTAPPTRPPAAIVPSDPIAQASLAFVGNPSPAEIRSKLDAAFAIYGLEPTDDNYSRAGSVLVALRQEAEADGYPAITEMAILEEMIAGGGVPDLSFPEAAAWVAALLRG